MLNQSTALDGVFQALADPARRIMVERLSRGPASVSELAKPLAMSLSAVVQHLQVLEASGLVRSAKAGRVRTCRIDAKALKDAEDWIAGRRATVAAPPRPPRRLSAETTRRLNPRELMMTERSTQHATFVIERVYEATPARVFHAWADPKAKAAGSPAPTPGKRARTSSTSGSAGASA